MQQQSSAVALPPVAVPAAAVALSPSLSLVGHGASEDNPYFIHIRYGIELDASGRVEVSGQGGLTVAYSAPKNVLCIALARCSIADNFCYKTGRDIATKRLRAGMSHVKAANRLAKLGQFAMFDLADGPTMRRIELIDIILKHLQDNSPDASIISVKSGKRFFRMYV